MKIALTTHGTRGDVQPFVTLALALMERGHDVTLGAPPNLTGFVERCGVRASKLAIDSQAFLESERGRAWLAAGDVSGFMKGLGKENEKLVVSNVSYEVTDPTVESQIIQLKSSGATVFFCHATPKHASQAIRKAAEIGWKPAFYLVNVSISVDSVLKPAGFDASQGIITSKAAEPTPSTAKWPMSLDRAT